MHNLYKDIRLIHFGNLMTKEGRVSPLCAKRPRKLNLKISTWTNRKEAVTCKKCLNKLNGAFDKK